MAVLLDLFLPRPAWSHSTAELLDFESERMSVPTLEKFAFFRQHARLKAARTYDTHGKKQDDDLHA